ncbi:MAG: LacI family DNA-binding transcriptional regulator [Phycisphaeraceae bacterium]|nr:LacI family DNA-binding transcriptional regulator [Phycisphaeraceae bacterium]
MPNVTMEDIAKHLGVSRAAVSYALSGQARKRGVSKKLEQKILLEAQNKGYRPSRLAQSLVRKRTNTLGLILPNMKVSYGPILTESLETAARQAGYQVLLAHHGGDLDRFREVLTTMVGWHVDGLAIVPLVGSCQAEAMAEIKRLQVPTVLLERDIAGGHVHTVTCDVEVSIHMAMDHLLKLGHKRIALLNAAKELFESHKREDAYQQHLIRNGIAFEPSLVFAPELSASSQLEDTVSRMLNLPDRPTAVVVNSGERAIALYLTCQRRGVDIPRDLSVVALSGMVFDDFSRMRFTCVRMTYEENGRVAFDALQNEIERGRTNPKRMLTSPVWVDGDSTAPPRRYS